MILLLYYLIFYDKKYSTKINICIEGETKPSIFAVTNDYHIYTFIKNAFFWIL